MPKIEKTAKEILRDAMNQKNQYLAEARYYDGPTQIFRTQKERKENQEIVFFFKSSADTLKPIIRDLKLAIKSANL